MKKSIDVSIYKATNFGIIEISIVWCGAWESTKLLNAVKGK